MLARIKSGLLAILAIASGILFGLWQRSTAKVAKRDKQDAEAQRDTLHRANVAIQQSGEQAREDQLKQREKAARGDFSGMDRDW